MERRNTEESGINNRGKGGYEEKTEGDWTK
jgi:hypothetical protein